MSHCPLASTHNRTSASIQYSYTHTFDNFFQGGTIPLILDVLRLSRFYRLLIDVDKTQKPAARNSRNRKYSEYPADYVQLSGTVMHGGSWPWCYMLLGSWTPDPPSKYGWLSFWFTLAKDKTDSVATRPTLKGPSHLWKSCQMYVYVCNLTGYSYAYVHWAMGNVTLGTTWAEVKSATDKFWLPTLIKYTNRW